MTRTSFLLSRLAPSALLAALASTTALGEPMTSGSSNTYTMPGLIDMPTAEVFADGDLGASISASESGRRYGLAFQALPGLTAALRYGEFVDFYPPGHDNGTSLYDRSFDLHYQLFGEQGWRPAVAIGLRDIVGTGIYSSEYVVATKTLRPGLTVTGGIGWGRLGSAGGLGSPFGDRPATELGTNETGKVEPGQWFRGEAAPFFGAKWEVNDKLTLKAEYSSDDYTEEQARQGFDRKTPLNFGADYRFGRFSKVSGYLLHGSTVGVELSMLFNPRQSPYPSGLEKGPAPVRPRPAPGADPEGWSGAWAADPTAQPAIQKALGDALAKEGQVLEAMSLSADRAEVRVRNTRYEAEAEAIGRTARLMSRAMPPSVETFVITRMVNGMPIASTTISRAGLERGEHDAAGRLLPAVAISDARSPDGLVPSTGAYPRLSWSLQPYVTPSLFDPDQPMRVDLGASLSGTYELTPGFILSGELRQRVVGNLKDSERGDSGSRNVPVVRTDTVLYQRSGDLFIPRLTAAWYAQPLPETYSRVTAGLLEPAFGGVSGEILWKPTDSRLALGAEVNWVRKRDYDQRFSFQDYKTTTGHVSAYYDFGGGYLGQVDVGKYLAGDVGATVTVEREFANGWRVGAFATKTDMSSEDFGEGAFDKGIRVSVPLGWAVGTPSKRIQTGTLRSLSRDGGARLDVDGRLYDTVRRGQTGKIYESWGRFWR